MEVQSVLRAVVSFRDENLLPREGGWPYPLYWPVSIVATTVSSLLLSVLAYGVCTTFFPSFASEDKEKTRSEQNHPTRDVWLSFFGNHFLSGVGAAASFAVNWYRGNLWWDVYDIPAMSPTELAAHVVYVIVCTAVMVLVYDGLTYFFHRLEHQSRWLYRLLHQQHHENAFPASPVESIYGDFLEGTIIGWFFFAQCCLYPQLPVSSVAMGATFIAVFTQCNHCGVDVKIPWLAYDSQRHLWHHQKYNVNFAEHTPFWDMLFGTAYNPQWTTEHIM